MKYLARLLALEASDPPPLAKTPERGTDRTDERGRERAFVTFDSSCLRHIPEIDTGEVETWRAALALLRRAPPLPGMSEARWRELVSDAIGLVDEWGERAHGLGWRGLDLFGCSSGFARRLDRDGLAMLLSGRPVLAMTEQAATIGNPRSAPNTFTRATVPGAVLFWEA